MSSDRERRRPTREAEEGARREAKEAGREAKEAARREAKEAGREAKEAARREAKAAGDAARRKAKAAAETAKARARQAAEDAREEAIEAAFAARREAHAARDRARNGADDDDGQRPGDVPFGLLWEPDDARPTRGRGSGLHRSDIVTVALRIADEEGPDAVSMRRIAKELGVGTMSLYHHVPTKDDLLDLMHDQVMGELLVPADELAADWREALAQISRRTRGVYTRHTWMVSGAWERPQFGPRAFAHIEQSLQIMDGLPRDRSLRMLGAADDYVIGFVSRQVAARKAYERAGLDEHGFQEALRPYVEGLLERRADEFPALAAFTGEDWVQDEDERFEAGLQWLLAGMAQDLRSDA